MVTEEWLQDNESFASDARVKSVGLGLQRWVRAFVSKHELKGEAAKSLKPFCERVEDVVAQQATQIPPIAVAEQDMVSISDKRAMSAFGKRFVIAYVDKFASKFMFVCRKLYARLRLAEFMPSLLGESESGGTYETISASAEEIVSNHTRFLQKEGIKSSDFRRSNRNSSSRPQ